MSGLINAFIMFVLSTAVLQGIVVIGAAVIMYMILKWIDKKMEF